MFARFGCSVLTLVLILSCNSLATLYEGDQCFLKDGREGICVLIKECPTAIQLLKKLIFPVLCGFKGIQPIVCCKEFERTTKMINTTATKTSTSRTPGDISKQKCKEYSEYAYEKIIAPTLLLKPQFKKRLVCDIPRSKLVVGTTLASRRQFPHMALIGYKTDYEVLWLCGGSLISENFVLTAAHCLFTQKGPAKLVRLGLTNKITESAHMQERTVSEIISHAKFNNHDFYYDIGLLRLSRNVKLNTYVRPACLQTEKYIPYDLAIASGWGIFDFTEDLVEIVMELSSADKCNYRYRSGNSSERLKYGIVDDLMICAGSSTRGGDKCTGDVGGPLQVYHKENEEVKCMYDIIGVISYGKSCGLKISSPGLYTRISAYIKWIEDTVWPN